MSRAFAWHVVVMLLCTGCAHQSRIASPPITVPAPPEHGHQLTEPADEARRRAEQKLQALSQHMRDSAQHAHDPSEPRPAGSLGSSDIPTTATATAGTIIVTTPTAPVTHDPGKMLDAPALPDESEAPSDRTPLTLPFVIAAGLIAAIVWLPRLTDRSST